MNVQFTARHFHASDDLKENCIARAQELTRFYENITSAHVVLDTENELRKKAEIVLAARGKNITAQAEDEKLGKAIDEAFDKVERQLKKLNEKVKDHKDQGLKRSIDRTPAAEEE